VLGVSNYSSAIYNFVPQFAEDVYAAVRAGGTAFVFKALNEFVIPFCNLRNRKAGYPVSIIKAGMTVICRPAGPVRPPLTDLDTVELAELADLVKKVN
jgi:5-dehydro-4-deoxyglucarate dehydratase